MAEIAKKIAAYEDLYNIPDNMTGEIIDGELIVTPRPSRNMYTLRPPWIRTLDHRISLAKETVLAAGSFSWNRKLGWEGIFWLLIWPDVGRNGSRYQKRLTGSQSARIGSPRCSRLAPCMWIRSGRCRSMDNMVLDISGLSIPSSKLWKFSAWNRAGG